MFKYNEKQAMAYYQALINREPSFVRGVFCSVVKKPRRFFVFAERWPSGANPNVKKRYCFIVHFLKTAMDAGFVLVKVCRQQENAHFWKRLSEVKVAMDLVRGQHQSKKSPIQQLKRSQHYDLIFMFRDAGFNQPFTGHFRRFSQNLSASCYRHYIMAFPGIWKKQEKSAY